MGQFISFSLSKKSDR